MAAPTRTDERGILAQPRATVPRFALVRHLPAEDLAEIIDRFWVVRWDLGGEPALEQETLPFPCVNMVVGDHRPGIHGPLRTRFVARLEGRGRVLGAKFRPAGFRGLLPRGTSSADLVDRVLSLADGFGGEGEALEHAIVTTDDAVAAIAHVERFVRARHAGLDVDDREANRVVELARIDPSLTRVADLAARVDMPVRALERLLRARIGVPPKALLRGFRVQEAAVRLAAGATVDLASLALELGYFDQPHFIRDFKSQVGRTPAQYAKLCAS